MRELLNKELRLSANPLSFFFIAFGLIPFFPGYPILLSAFFTCLGIFQSFQKTRETNDILYSALLPVKKSDVVKSKYIFCAFIELCAFLLSGVVVIIRMTVLKDALPYRENALMNANPAFLGFMLAVFGLFNSIFVGGFFKTAYKIAKPFVVFCVSAFVAIGLVETLHHIPGLGFINAFGFDHIGEQLLFLCGGAVIFALLTLISEKKSEKTFEKIDL